MKKEHIKTLILVLLLVNCVQLTAQIWFDKKLWPSGYNFFSSAQNIPVIGSVIRFFGGSRDVLSNEELYDRSIRPARLVINGSGAREVYGAGTDDYQTALSHTDALLEQAGGASAEQISNTDWENLFKSKSIYIDFGYSIDGVSFGRLHNLSDTGSPFDSVSAFSGVLLVPDSGGASCTAALFDQDRQQALQYSFSCDSSGVLDYIASVTYGRQQNHAFAFELHLDTGSVTESAVARRVALRPLLLLSTEPLSRRAAVFHPPFSNSIEMEHFAEKAISVFGYNASSLRMSVSKNNTISYVENGATIRFYQNGLVEYTAVSADTGIAIPSAPNAGSAAVSKVLELVYGLHQASGNAPGPDIQLASDFRSNREGRYAICLNYLWEGTPIIFQDGVQNAIVAEIQNGRIVKLTMHVVDPETTGEAATGIPVLEAIDRLFSVYNGTENVVIENIFACYVPGDGLSTLQWAIKLEGQEALILVPAAEE